MRHRACKSPQRGYSASKFYSLSQTDDQTPGLKRNTHVHGLTDEMVADAPTFSELFPLLKSLIEDFRLYVTTAPQTSSLQKLYEILWPGRH